MGETIGEMMVDDRNNGKELEKVGDDKELKRLAMTREKFAAMKIEEVKSLRYFGNSAQATSNFLINLKNKKIKTKPPLLPRCHLEPNQNFEMIWTKSQRVTNTQCLGGPPRPLFRKLLLDTSFD